MTFGKGREILERLQLLLRSEPPLTLEVAAAALRYQHQKIRGNYFAPL